MAANLLQFSDHFQQDELLVFEVPEILLAQLTGSTSTDQPDRCGCGGVDVVDVVVMVVMVVWMWMWWLWCLCHHGVMQAIKKRRVSYGESSYGKKKQKH